MKQNINTYYLAVLFELGIEECLIFVISNNKRYVENNILTKKYKKVNLVAAL